MRRLTNFSTGRLGSELAHFLAASGHRVTLLIGKLATYHADTGSTSVQQFSTTEDLGSRLSNLAGQGVDAVFHAAAVSDFKFGRVYAREANGTLSEVRSGKFSTRSGTLLVELVSTSKIIANLRNWFPQATIVGWKYEVEGDRATAIEAAHRQIEQCRTDCCVANGPAYGDGFGLVAPASCVHIHAAQQLYTELAQRISAVRRVYRA